MNRHEYSSYCLLGYRLTHSSWWYLSSNIVPFFSPSVFHLLVHPFLPELLVLLPSCLSLYTHNTYYTLFFIGFIDNYTYELVHCFRDVVIFNIFYRYKRVSLYKYTNDPPFSSTVLSYKLLWQIDIDICIENLSVRF